MKCGCKINLKYQAHGTTIDVTADIDWCPLHAAAEEMRDALNRLIGWAEILGPEPDEKRSTKRHWCAIKKAKAILAVARGSK